MIAEAGHLALLLALAAAALQALGGLVGAARAQAPAMAMAVRAAALQALLLATAFGALIAAHVRSDFSVLNVAENSHSALPLLYKATGAWGNHEGSMLLWVLLLALFGAAVAGLGRRLPLPLRARVLGVQGLLGLGFIGFVAWTSNPFLRLDPAATEGRDLNPLLQDIGLAVHPPWLYTGYVGFSVAFSFAVAALLEGRVDPAWARWVRPWTLAAWSALTVGIGLGSWWSYYELGWGGWWAWDPVENASLLPWLSGTALLHSAAVAEKRDAMKRWTVLLAILSFAFSLLGTFLVRSGVLTSVHAFAVDPARGAVILALLVLTVGGALTLYALKAEALHPGSSFAPVSREGGLVLNNLLLCTAAATLLTGTIYPLLLDAATGATVSVGPPYFQRAVLPLLLAAVAAMGAGPLLAWKRADLAGVLQRLRAAALACLGLAAAVLAVAGLPSLTVATGLVLGLWALLAALTDLAERARLGRARLAESWARLCGLPRAVWGAALAHGGLGIAVLAMTISAGWVDEKLVALRPGDSLSLAGRTLVFDGVERVAGANYSAEQGRFRLEDGSLLLPQRRRYVASAMETTEAAIRTGLWSDLYIVLGDADGSGAHSVRLWHHPAIPWLWIGGLVMALGGALSLTDRRLRLAPTKTRAHKAQAIAAR